MTNRQHRKVRYVKCPKCTRILPEPEDASLYKCGVCYTVLQAKNYRSRSEASVLNLPTEDVVQSNDNGHACGVEDSSGSSQRSSSGEQSSNQIEGSDKNTIDDCNHEQIGAESCANQTSLSEEAGVPKTEGGKQILIQSNGNGHACEVGESSGSSRRSSYSGEQSLTQNEERNEKAVDDSGGSSSPCETTKMHLGGEHSTDTVPGNEINCLAADKPVAVAVAVANLGKEDDSGKQQENMIEHVREKLPSVANSSDTPKSTEVTQDGNESSLPGAEARLGASGSHSASDLSSDSGKCASGVSQNPAGEISSLDNVEETSRHKIENIEGSAFNESGPNSSPDKTETSELVDTHTHEKVGSLLKEVPHSPAKRSLADDEKPETSEPADTYEKDGNLITEITRSPVKTSSAYDGSVSSCDGNDDQVTGQQEHLDGETFSENDAVVGYAAVGESSERYIVQSNRRNHSNWRTQAQVNNSSSQVKDEKLKSSMVEEEQSVRENDIPRHNRTRHHRDGLFPPRIPVHGRSSELAFETGSSSSYAHDDPPSHWTRNHPYRYEDQEPWRRPTYAQREYMQGRRFSEAAWRNNDFLPMYYNDEVSGEIYQKQRYHGYNDRRRRADSWSLSGNLPRPRYSGEMYNGRYQGDEYYMHRQPDGRGWSTQLPSGPTRVPPAGYYRQGPMTFMDPSRDPSWEPYDTYSSNLQRFLDLESYAWAHDAVYLSDDQRHTDWIKKRSYVRERRQAMKRHLRPMAGGAPFITCHFCFRILQLPEEFLVSKRRNNHRLKCGACSNVLEFSLENESCLAPRLPCTGEGAETNLDRPPSLASQSRQSVLASEEAPTNGKDELQHNSFGALGRQKSKLTSRNSRNGERRDESYDTAETSTQSKQVKVTWQLPARSKSPLHRLMGYSSPQDLLTANRASDIE